MVGAAFEEVVGPAVVLLGAVVGPDVVVGVTPHVVLERGHVEPGTLNAH